MKVLLDLVIIPMGVGLSVSGYIAECERIFKEAGLKTQLHANGTNIEGEWEVAFAAVQRCHEKLHEMGAPRIHTVINLGTRIDKDQSLEDKVNSVQSKLKDN